MTVATLTETANRRVGGWLAQHSIDLLRMSLGIVFLGFGALKFIPGLSPAEPLVVRTLDALSFGLVHGHAALLLTAVAECFIGLTLITGKLLKTGLAVLGLSMVGILSPMVLFFTDLFPGGPTLEAQYVFKDIVLVAAGLVVAARALGARMVR
jgi:putative oxidoreductase